MAKGPTIVEQLTRWSDALDQLLRDASCGPRHEGKYHREEAEAQRIAAGLIATYRGVRR